MEPDLRHLLERTNPWFDDPSAAAAEASRRLPPTFVPRLATPAMQGAMTSARTAHLVVGPRQAGKSTLIWHALATSPSPLLFVNCEEPLVQLWCRSPGLAAADMREWLPTGGIVFLEEAQYLAEAGLFVKGLVDAHTDLRVVVTGSSSFHLEARTRESLAGRATRHRLWPLALQEVAPDIPGRSKALLRNRARTALDRMLVFGGYPEAWTADDPRPIQQELVTAFVLRDASDRFRIERPDAFRLMLRLAAGQVGDLVNLTEWAHILGTATSTVSDYASLAEETHVLRLVRPFAGGKRAEMTRTPKVYWVDNGLRNAVAGGFDAIDERIDTGKLMENWVFSELLKRYTEPGDIRFWRTRNGGELDFVLEPEPGQLVAIEVKSGRAGPPRVARALRSFVHAYQPRVVMIVHRGEPDGIEIDGVPVRWIPAEMLPAALDAL